MGAGNWSAQDQTLRFSSVKPLDYFFTPKTASFATLATRNLTTVLAGILTGHTPTELLRMDQFDNLRKNSFSREHAPRIGDPASSRSHPFLFVSPYHSTHNPSTKSS